MSAPGPGPARTPPDGGEPARIHPRDLAVILVGGALAVAGMALLVPGTWGEHYALRLWLPVWVIATAVHGGALLEAGGPWVKRVRRVGRSALAQWGGGAYAAIALVVFLWLEWARGAEFVQQVLGLTSSDAVRELIRGLFDFGLDSFMNGVHAIAWPAFWDKAFSAGHMWAAALVAWGVFASARWAVRHASR